MIQLTTGDLMHVYGAFGAGVDYAVRLTVRLKEAVDPDLLREALAKTQERYPYLLVRLRENAECMYYEKNPLPVMLVHTGGRIKLGSEETNFHLWAVCWQEDYLYLDMFHGLTDGDGMYRVLATLLYHYCIARYGEVQGLAEGQEAVGGQAEGQKTAALKAVELLTGPVREGENEDPQDTLPDIDLTKLPPAAQPVPAFTLETDGGLTPSEPTIWDVEIPQEPFMRFTSANDASPGTMISLLFAKAIDSLYPADSHAAGPNPARSKGIVNAYVINARPMLHAEETRHVCLSMAMLDYSDRIRQMPLDRQCTVYRGKTFAQSYEPAVAKTMTQNANLLRAALQSAKTLEEKKKVFGQAFNGGEGVITFLVSYTGKWKYPALGKHMTEFWTHTACTFSLMAEIGAADGRIFLSIQQRFKEDRVREAFLQQLRDHRIPYTVRRVMACDNGVVQI